MTYNLTTVDKGAVQVNDKNAIWRKLVPTGTDLILTSDLVSDKGADWKINQPYQYNVMCINSPLLSLVAGTVQDWAKPAFGLPSGASLWTVWTVDTPFGISTLTGIDRASVPQCQIILYNSGPANIIVQRDNGVDSQPQNRFTLGSATVVLQPGEAGNFYYNEVIQRWMLASHI